MGNFDAALENYRRAIDLRPDAIEFKLDLAMHYYRSGDHPSAERELVPLRGTPIAAAAYMEPGYDVDGCRGLPICPGVLQGICPHTF